MQTAEKGDKMGEEKQKALTAEDISKINSILARDQSAEVKPTRDGVRVFRIRREEVKK